MGRQFLLEEERESEEGFVNLTPLIDVLFVVLILFILSAPLLRIERIDLASAPPEKKEEVAPTLQGHVMQIQVLRDNSIRLNGVPISEKELLPLLQEAKKKHPRAVPLLLQDSSSQFGCYQSIKNAVEMAGFSEMDLLLKPSG